MYFLINMTELALWILLFSSIIPIFILILIVLIKRLVQISRGRKPKAPLTNDVIDIFGGLDNILNVTRDLSRISVEVKSLDNVDLEKLRSLNVGTLISGNTVKCSSDAIADSLMPLVKK